MSRSRSKRPPQPPTGPPAPAAPTSEASVPPSAPEPPAASAPPSEPVPAAVEPVEPAMRGGTVGAALRLWFSAYRVEVALFLVSFVVLASFSSQRFLRQSAAPHFIYQAQSWLEGRLDVDPEVLPNLEDWACVRNVAARRCAARGGRCRAIGGT